MSEKPKLILCPYCGNTQTEPEDRCGECGGFFDSLSLKVTQQHMGPWFVRDRNNPFRPGCSYEVLVKQIEKGKVKTTTIVRGPTTRQFWSVARHVPGISHLLGYCHNCGKHVEPSAESCSGCGEVFFQPRLRDNLGLAAAGAEVYVQPKLSDSGAFEAMEDQPHTIDKPMKLPGMAGAVPPKSGKAGAGIAATISSFSSAHAQQQRQVADQPVGSSILAGLRPEPTSQDAVTVMAATAQASASRDAMAWMTGSDQSELDSLATAAAGYTPPRRAGMSWLTWVLIAVNMALLAAGAAVVFIALRGQQPSISDADAPSNNHPTGLAGANDDEMSANVPKRHERAVDDTEGGAGGPTVKLPDVVDSPSDPKSGSPLPVSRAPVGIADPTAGQGTGIFTEDTRKPVSAKDQARLNWAARFKEGGDAEKRGDLDQALRIYTEIQTKAPADVQPVGVNQALERVETAINRRNIEKVLGK